MAVAKYLLIGLCIFTSACGALDDGGSDSPAQLTGLWLGSTQEQGVTEALTTSVLFFEDQVFVLREDEAHVGTYTILENDSALLDTTVYSYGTPDTENNFYVGTRGSDRIEVDALFASADVLFLNFDGSSRSGSATLTLDTGLVTNISLTRVRGTWGTTDSVLYINDEGGIQGSNSATGCQWKGTLSSLSSNFLKLSIERNLCDEFNQAADSPTDGFAFIDGEGSLHFIAEQPNEFLWMQFTSDTTTATDETEEEEVEEAAEEE